MPLFKSVVVCRGCRCYCSRLFCHSSAAVMMVAGFVVKMNTKVEPDTRMTHNKPGEMNGSNNPKNESKTVIITPKGDRIKILHMGESVYQTAP